MSKVQLHNKVSQTFVVATLNRLDALPPELTRLGRFGEIFYVDFPQAGERKDILHFIFIFNFYDFVYLYKLLFIYLFIYLDK
ncbi:hypothetical protein [Coleofasciculus chthonoplastes]|uniref:hypothetical protein n=1 Tax=Coleofasciculus chthonoplastes TaxID=64178 RepID=UPI0033006439